MLVELSPSAYLTICGLVRDAQQVESDASPLLERVANELAGVMNDSESASEMSENPRHMDALRHGGFLAVG